VPRRADHTGREFRRNSKAATIDESKVSKSVD